jgi:hypothetical protein
MDPDLLFVIGVVTLLFSVPSILGAFTDGRPPRAAAILIMVGGGLLGLAIYQRPGVYTFETVPDVFYTVIGRYIG